MIGDKSFMSTFIYSFLQRRMQESRMNSIPSMIMMKLTPIQTAMAPPNWVKKLIRP